MANGSGELGEEVGIHQTPDNAYMDSLSSSKCSREWSDPGISNIYSEGRRRNHQSMVIKACRHGNACHSRVMQSFVPKPWFDITVCPNYPTACRRVPGIQKIKYTPGKSIKQARSTSLLMHSHLMIIEVWLAWL